MRLASLGASVSDRISYLKAMRQLPFIKSIAQMFITGFPDRLARFLALTSTIMSGVMAIMAPLLPRSLKTKLEFFTRKKMVQHLTENVLKNGLEDLPDFFGGPLVHPRFETFSAMISELESCLSATPPLSR